MKKWIVSAVILGLLGFAVFSYIDKKDHKTSPNSGDVAEVSGNVTEEANEVGLDPGMAGPDFTLETLEGETVSLADYEGQKVLLNFWATWCPPSRDEMPDMPAFHEEYGGDVTILGVNLTETEANEDNIESFLAEMGVDFTVLKDLTRRLG